MSRTLSLNSGGIRVKGKDEDEELERIKRKKLQELMRKAQQEERKMDLDKPIEITDTTLSKTLQDHPFVVVDCWAPWCAPCRMIAPVLEELARDYSGKIVFGKLNVDKNPNAAVQYKILSIPNLLVFKNGELVDRIVGAMPRELLEPRIIQHLTH